MAWGDQRLKIDYRHWIRFFLITLFVFAGFPAKGEVFLDGEEIVFGLSVPREASVYLVGDFNNWNPTIDKMIWNNNQYEIRLYLLPGKHRYLYLVNGELRPDSDHSFRDKEGRSCFYFREDNGRYTLRFSEEFRVNSKTRAPEPELSAEITTIYEKDYFMGSLKGNFDGNIAGNTRLRISSAILRDSGRVDENIGPVLLRSEALSEAGKWKIRAFYRMGKLGFDDPLELIGGVGPYDYPLGLFCRGIDVGVALTEQFSGRVFYAGRLEGYRSGLETGELDPAYGNLLQFLDRNPGDSDIIGAMFGGTVGGINMRYLFRRDKRYVEWGFSGDEGECLFGGAEEVNINGVWCSYKPCDSTLIELEYLSGTTSLSQAEEFLSQEEEYCLNNGSGESGWKLYAGIEKKFRTADLEFSYSCQKRNDSFKENLGVKNGMRQRVGFDAGMTISGFHWGVEGAAENYSNLPPDYFWIRRKNFWLDGDTIDSNRLFFLRSSGTYSVRLEARKLDAGNTKYPCSGNLGLSLLLMCERDNLSDRVIEMKIIHSIPARLLIPFKLAGNNSFFNGIDLLADIRGVLYNHQNWNGKRGFIDPFFALRKSFAYSSWCMIGVGLNPYVFDKWHYGITCDGREKFLEDKGVFRKSAVLNQREWLEILGNAEEEMSASWIISFEAGLTF
jgi:hypothetical protein